MRTSVLVVAGCLTASPVLAQVKRPDPVTWQLGVNPPSAAPGSPVLVTFTATIEEGWHLYSPTTPPGPIPTELHLKDGPAVAPGWKLYQPAPQRRFDPNFQTDLLTFDKEAAFVFEAAVPGDAPSGAAEIAAEVRYQACNDQVCLRPVVKSASASLQVAPGAARAAAIIPAGYSEVPLETAAAPAAALSPAEAPAPTQTAAAEGWSQYLLLAFGFGLAAIFTPCVFPMIPITMSYFLNSSARPVQHALGFCLGIVVLFTGLGLATTAVLGPFGVVQLGSNPWVNAFIAMVFVSFGLSLLGAYEITLPSGLLTRLTTASQSGGFAGTLLMGLTFALTSFACVGPFMGTLLAASVQGGRLRPVLGMGTFAAGLASPFFLLALFPQYMSRLPKSGAWMLRVKVVFGFIVLALALKYFSNVDEVMHWGLITRERYLAAWAVLFGLPGLYLLGLLRMEGVKAEQAVGVGRALVAAALLAFSLSLLPGLFGGSLGELEAYVPAARGGSVFGGGPETKLAWMKDDYQGAIARARAEGRLVFVNFTGYACTNCKWMKANMFPKPEIAAALSRFVLVDLYTDGTDAASEANQKLQETKFQTVAIPHYAIVRPDDRESVVASFVGQTRNVSLFLEFLNKGQTPASAGSLVSTSPAQRSSP